MASSKNNCLVGFDPWEAPSRTCGPLGWNDAAEPFSLLSGDTPGSLGILDLAAPNQILEKAAEKQKSPSKKLTKASADPNFNVSQGQVTFDAEGNDDSKSQYFSRHVHWPGNAESGVTLGRGYDMGNRLPEDVKADLIAAGLSEDKATAFAKGALKKGADAQKFVKENQAKLGLIKPEEQKKLFELIYPGYVERARQNYEKWTVAETEKVAWSKLSTAVRDVLVDFVYQGFTKGPRPMLAGINDDADELIEYIGSNPTMKSYEVGRRRIDYLKRYGDI